jgi:hypothetical protein
MSADDAADRTAETAKRATAETATNSADGATETPA